MLKPIKNEDQYEDALERIYNLMQKDDRSVDETDELEILSILVKDYEKVHYPVPNPHPLEAIKIKAEQMGVSESELSRILGNRSRKSEIFSGKRKLTLSQIRRLREALHIPAEILIQAF